MRSGPVWSESVLCYTWSQERLGGIGCVYNVAPVLLDVITLKPCVGFQLFSMNHKKYIFIYVFILIKYSGLTLESELLSFLIQRS